MFEWLPGQNRGGFLFFTVVSGKSILLLRMGAQECENFWMLLVSSFCLGRKVWILGSFLLRVGKNDPSPGPPLPPWRPTTLHLKFLEITSKRKPCERNHVNKGLGCISSPHKFKLNKKGGDPNGPQNDVNLQPF